MYKLSIIVPVYIDKNNDATQLFYDDIASMGEYCRNGIELIFIDDCSLVSVRVKTDGSVNFKQFRIDQRIFWNVSGAKNLGSHVAKGKKLLFIDLDHKITESGLVKLIDMDIKNNQLVNFDRGDKIVPGIFCLNASYYKKMGGLDEIFAGEYGYEDVHFQNRHKKSGNPTVIIDGVLSCRGVGHHSIKRVVGNVGKARNLKHSGIFLNFKWHRVI